VSECALVTAPYEVAFVSSIPTTGTAAATLDLFTDPWCVVAGTRFPPPPLRRAATSTLLADGELYPATAYENRTLQLRLAVQADTPDTIAGHLQDLTQQLDKATNFLRVRVKTTESVYFRTFRVSADDLDVVTRDKRTALVNVDIPAEPFGLGPKQTLPTVTVYNDPAEGTTLNANPFFETNVLNWTPVGGTFVRSTAHNISAPASGLLTPDGVTATVQVRSEAIATPVGQSVRASAWVWSTAARNVDIIIRWTDAADALISTTTVTTALGAGTWTFLDMTATAPANTVYSHLVISMGGTPPASNTIWIDDARLRFPGSVGGMCFDVTGVIGDVETPLYLSLPAFPLIDETSVFAVRRHGDVTQVPFVLQAEAATLLGTDTSLGAFDSAMSGAGSNYARVTFATDITLTSRLDWSGWPNANNIGIRGTYRVFARVRRSVAGDTVRLRLDLLYNGAVISNSVVALPTVGTLRYVDLGLVSLPGSSDPVTDGPTGVELTVRGSCGLRLNASRDSGTSNLDVDVLVFMPADDRLVLVSWGEPGSVAASYILDSLREAAYGIDASGFVTCEAPMGVAGGPPLVSPNVTNRVYYIPSVRPTGVADSKTTTTVITPYYWPRYLNLRPVGT
jgi:hypothetical protein